MDTALYYTFSTIAQTLAGVLAILGAFFLFHLIRINAQLGQHLQELKTRYDEKGTLLDLQELWVRGDASALITYFTADRLGILNNEFGNLRLDRARALFDHKSILLTEIERVTAVTIATMIASFVVLAITPWIGRIPGRLGAAVFFATCGVGISSAGYCLTRYGRLARQIVGARV